MAESEAMSILDVSEVVSAELSVLLGCLVPKKGASTLWICGSYFSIMA